MTPVDIVTRALASDQAELACDVHYQEIHDMA